MLAKNHGAAALWSAAAATRKNQGAVFALASKPGKAVRSESGGGPAYKEAARKRLAGKAKKGSSSAADIEPPALPSLLQGPKPQAKPVMKPVVKAMEVQVSALKKSSRPLSLEQKLRKVFFDKKVKQEEAKLIAANQQRADALIVDPDAMVANGEWGASKATSLAAPVPKTARLAAKATGPAAAILQMIGFSANDKYL
jgi:hypothetical protein